MTVVITPVGTSLFTNGGEHNFHIKDLFADIKDLRDSDWGSWEDQITNLKNESESFILEKNVSASAELQSTYTILENLEGNITVCLFASDTIASRLAAEILQENSCVLGNRVSIEFNYPNDVIRGLQVTDPVEFLKDGVPNLKQWLFNIHNKNPANNQNLAINITGGFAATVPCLTIFASPCKIPLYYNFENATTLINLL
ncbi:MAG: hypothetical protein OXN27_04880 [Candidatus Poribacteria bacterium]|nr:hypothetical protein [Candidatus Poribacteria bacterium]